MSKCGNCGRVIWVWPNGMWTHRHNDSQLCYTGPGADYTKRASYTGPIVKKAVPHG